MRSFSRAPLCLLWLCLPALLWAGVGGSVSGTVKDPSGAAIVGASVVLANINTGVQQTVTTNARGAYTFPVLPVGTYTLAVNHSGFGPYRRTRIVLDEEQVQAARKEDVLDVLSQIAIKFRTKVGESLATVKQHSTPLEEATTTSLEALKAYSAGWKHVTSDHDLADAVPLFKRAIEIDFKFALAHAALGFTYGFLSESALSAESNKKAYELRDRASDRRSSSSRLLTKHHIPVG